VVGCCVSSQGVVSKVAYTAYILRMRNIPNLSVKCNIAEYSEAIKSIMYSKCKVAVK